LYRSKSIAIKLGKTPNFLELTLRLLGDVRVEKERWAGAYVIPASDLTPGNELGNGAFGGVVRGMWVYGTPRPCLVGAVYTLLIAGPIQERSVVQNQGFGLRPSINTPYGCAKPFHVSV
jgi:hypothetical protein